MFACMTGPDSFEYYPEFLEYCKKNNARCYELENAAIGIVKTKTPIIKVAQRYNVTLLFYGYMYLPTPGWDQSGSPLDDGQETANFLLNSYLSSGGQVFSQMNGHYALVIHDARKGQECSLLIRDQSGQNDLFYYQKACTTLISNKVSAIADFCPDQPELNRGVEDFFLTYGFYPMDETVYQGIKSVPAQSILRIDKCGNIKVEPLHRKPVTTDPAMATQTDLIEELYNRLTKITQYILPTEKQKVAVLLGGFDSALVAALLKQQGYDVETFTFCYSDQRFNQIHTDTLAQYLDIKHNWVEIDEKVIEDGLDRFSQVFNQPTNFPSYVIQTAYLCEVIRDKGIEYCYTGDGCDSQFYGYPITYQRARIMSAIGKIPNSVLNVILKLAERPKAERWIGRPFQVMLGILRSAKRPKNERSFLTFRIFDELSLRQLRLDLRPKQKKVPEEIVGEIAKQYTGVSSVKRAYEGKKQVSPNRSKLNGSADVSGLVIASPYMHPELTSFMEEVPDELLRPEGAKTSIGKYILSKMAEEKQLLPKSIIYQPKIGAADSPIEQWYQHGLRRSIYRFIGELPFVADRNYVESLIDESVAEKLYAKFISKNTSGLVTMSHCISLLITYSTFNKHAKEKS